MSVSSCSICLDEFCSPVCTPCGHTFCLTCIGGYWSQAGVCRCPLCGASFQEWPELQRAGPREAGVAAEGPEAQAGEVACDVCTGGRRLRAVKSCVVCLQSYCREHLEPHYLCTALRWHPLQAVGKNLQTRRCGLHGRPLDRYCRTDRTCVCALCPRTDHRAHRLVPITRESRRRRAQLRKTMVRMQQMMQDRQKKVEEIRQCVELSRSSTQREIDDSMQVFSALVRSIETRQAKLTEELEEKQREAERRAEGLIKELEQELTELQRRNTELEQLSRTEDHLHFLQTFPSLCTPPHTRDWSDVIEKFLQEMQDLFQPQRPPSAQNSV
ncbi:hypothetical protein MATL_G00199800 [Megalops atlanticus]|uniref:Uncharacterized protein n=1 Tax=Megalops atlanticus TaxID=7932 RepID=A0A9D3PM12_MEGAT|nr:hypothetical protein MATL_G00199800 [Megalops atlanticus]